MSTAILIKNSPNAIRAGPPETFSEYKVFNIDWVYSYSNVIGKSMTTFK